MVTQSNTIIHLVTSNGVNAIVEINNAFQDITFKFPLISLEIGFAAVGSEFKSKVKKHFLEDDIVDIFNLIFKNANEEMQYNLVMR